MVCSEIQLQVSFGRLISSREWGKDMVDRHAEMMSW